MNVCVFLKERPSRAVDVDLTARFAARALRADPLRAVIVDGCVYDLVDMGGGVAIYRYSYRVTP